jgi:hypothetical protein
MPFAVYPATPNKNVMRVIKFDGNSTAAITNAENVNIKTNITLPSQLKKFIFQSPPSRVFYIPHDTFAIR